MTIIEYRKLQRQDIIFPIIGFIMGALTTLITGYSPTELYWWLCFLPSYTIVFVFTNSGLKKWT